MRLKQKKTEPVGKITDQDYDWWRKARFGIFIHWNTSSVLALGGGSWHRYPKPKEKTEASTNKTDYDTPFVLTDEIVKEYHVPWRMNPPREIYDNLFHVFNPVDFDAKAWAKTFKAAGAGYVVFTAKHHDGFCMFDSKFTKYNIMNTPFRRDICQELVDACAAEDIKVLWYFSVADWYDTRFDRKTLNHTKIISWRKSMNCSRKAKMWQAFGGIAAALKSTPTALHEPSENIATTPSPMAVESECPAFDSTRRNKN